MSEEKKCVNNKREKKCILISLNAFAKDATTFEFFFLIRLIHSTWTTLTALSTREQPLFRFVFLFAIFAVCCRCCCCCYMLCVVLCVFFSLFSHFTMHICYMCSGSVCIRLYVGYPIVLGSRALHFNLSSTVHNIHEML